MSQTHMVRILKSTLPVIMLVVGIGIPMKPLENSLVAEPGEKGPCTVEELSFEFQGIETTFFAPMEGSCDSWIQSPYPGLIFAHGFSMMGFTDGVADVAGHGEHLASWGYWVAIPALPDDSETRIENLRTVLDQLLVESNQGSSPLFQKIDPGRIAVSGYSLGGATALAAAARDNRFKTAVSLDPVYHEGGFEGEGAPIWNPEVDGKNIKIPTGILGSPPNSCNANADYADIYEYIEAAHKAAYLVVGASHCDFLAPGNSFCPIFCPGTTDSSRTEISQKFITAWLNYYLLLKSEYYSFLFGNDLQQDISQSVIQAEIATGVRNFFGIGVGNRMFLSWEVYEHPILDGYNIYRKDTGGVYPVQPYARLGIIGGYMDPAVIPGQEYSYKICSYDLDGNQHSCLAEITVLAGEGKAAYLPFIK